MNKNCHLFYKRLRILFPSIGFAEGKFLRDIKMQLRDFSIEHPTGKYEDVVEFFGNPEDVYIDYIQSQEKQEIYNKFQLRKSIKWMVYILFLIVTILCIVLWSFWQKSYSAFHDLMPSAKKVKIEEGDYYYEEN